MANIDLPDFKIDTSNIPIVKIKSLHFQKFKVFDDYFVDFSENNVCKQFACFIGPNGVGKTTILDSIQILFSRYDHYDKERLRALLGKSVRHTDGVKGGIYRDDDFLITANIKCSLGDYEIQINKSGFVKDHPEEVKWIIYRLCYYARFDQELHQFSLPRDKWCVFKDLFESVTGFKIEEKKSVFDESEDPIQTEILKQYVLNFFVHKKNEIISREECSSGERKIIKSFSTLLNKEYTPQIILIDNVAMHVESGRHLNLIESMKRCFPNSQIFCTTHSYQISRNMGDRKQLYDLRLLRSPDIIKNSPWRLYLMDEVEDYISKLKSMKQTEAVEYSILNCEELKKRCLSSKSDVLIQMMAKKIFDIVQNLYLKDLINYYS